MAEKVACLVFFLVFLAFFFLSPVPQKKADQLTDEQISEFKEAFSLFDKDSNDQGRNTATHQTSYSYDVFLSFSGPDTRHSFTGSLYHALTSKGFKVFMDDQTMKPGDRISRTLVNAIQQSRISIVVLSQNYASSTWCLDELVKILECMRLKNQLVWPVFYKVRPSVVRHQRESYAEAMAEHDRKYGDGSHVVQEWRNALTEVAGVHGSLTTGRSPPKQGKAFAPRCASRSPTRTRPPPRPSCAMWSCATFLRNQIGANESGDKISGGEKIGATEADHTRAERHHTCGGAQPTQRRRDHDHDQSSGGATSGGARPEAERDHTRDATSGGANTHHPTTSLSRPDPTRPKLRRD